MKKSIILVISLILGCSLITVSHLFNNSSVFIESKESKTITNDSVFNKIYYKSEKNRDIWMMNQSHHGKNAAKTKWDRVAIIVTKNTALFLQLPPGDLEWSDKLLKEEQPFKVSCFTCHSNGPRAIRPQNVLNFKDQLKVALWNLRIKTYGKIVEHPIHIKNDIKLKVPFRFRNKLDNETLKVASCTACHNDSGLFARNNLTRQNSSAISFMLKEKLMPPLGFSLTDQDNKKIKDFLSGF